MGSLLSKEERKFLERKTLEGMDEGERDNRRSHIRPKIKHTLDDLILVFKAEDRWKYDSDSKRQEDERKYEPRVNSAVEAYLTPKTQSDNEYIKDVHAYERAFALLDTIDRTCGRILQDTVIRKLWTTPGNQLRSYRWSNIALLETARHVYSNLEKKKE
jgi:hypothetical protein